MQIVVFLVLTIVVPIVINKTTESGRLDFIHPYLREIWMVLLVVGGWYLLWQPGVAELIMRHRDGRIAYLIVFLLGGVLLSCFWWATGWVLRDKPKTIPYPWVSGNTTLVDTGKPVQAVRLVAYVWDWPTANDDVMRGKLSIDSLFHFKGSVSRVESLIDNGWRSKIVMQLDESEWNNTDASKKPSGWILLDRETTVLTYRAEARKSHWDGYLILRKDGSDLEREEAITGVVSLDSGESRNMAITSLTTFPNGKLVVRVRDEYQPLTKERLKELGVPEIKPQ